jgi:hypothetical protein
MGGNIPHLVLLGDSTIDNRFYVGQGNPAIIDQLRIKVCERGWKATSVAVDGHSISHITSQLARIPHDATHLFISIGMICQIFWLMMRNNRQAYLGGNDALSLMQILQRPVENEGLLLLNESKKKFEQVPSTHFHNCLCIGSNCVHRIILKCCNMLASDTFLLRYVQCTILIFMMHNNSSCVKQLCPY